MFYELHQKVEYAFGKVFEKYGRFIARHPVKVICTVVIINIAQAVGPLTLKRESGIEQYAPTGSVASQNRDQVNSLFTFNTNENIDSQSFFHLGYFGTVIVERQDGGNILNSTLWSDISDVLLILTAQLLMTTVVSLLHMQTFAQKDFPRVS